MIAPRRLVVAATVLLALATFAVIQDRVTAAGARRYAALQREAGPDGAPAVTIESVMTPAIRRSVGWGGAAAGAVLVVGLGLASRLRR